MGGKKGKKGARKTHRKKGGADPVKIDWSIGFKAERVEPKPLIGDVQAYTLEWTPNTEGNILTIDFKGMGKNLSIAGDYFVITKVKDLISEKLYGVCGYDNMKNKAIYKEAAKVIDDNLNKISVVVFKEVMENGKGTGDLFSCTINDKPVPNVILLAEDTKGVFGKAIFKLKAAFNDLASEGKIRNLVQKSVGETPAPPLDQANKNPVFSGPIVV
jgi:hypothetical protein